MISTFVMLSCLLVTGFIACLDRDQSPTLARGEELFGTWALTAFRHGGEELINAEREKWVLRLTFAPGRTFLLSEWKNGQLTSARGLYLVADEMLTLIGGDLEGNKPTPIKEASFRLWEDKLTLSQEDPQDNEWQLFVFERRA